MKAFQCLCIKGLEKGITRNLSKSAYIDELEPDNMASHFIKPDDIIAKYDYT